MPPPTAGAAAGNVLQTLAYETMPSLHPGHAMHSLRSATLPGYSPVISSHQSGLAGGLSSSHLRFLDFDLPSNAPLQTVDMQQQQDHLYWPEVERQREYDQALSDHQALRYLQAQSGYPRWGPSGGLDGSRAFYGQQGLVVEPQYRSGPLAYDQMPYFGATATDFEPVMSLTSPYPHTRRQNDDLMGHLQLHRRNGPRAFSGQVCVFPPPAVYCGALQ